MASEPQDEFVEAATVDELRQEGRKLVTEGGRAIAVFHHEGEVRAVDNRCPHMGFPLTEGTVEDGLLTCHWHHARFDLACGDTLDPWADDVPTYPVEVRDGEVYVRPAPERDKPPAEHWTDRLQTGLRENLGLVLAKAAIGLDDAGVPPAEPFAEGVRFGTTYRADGWSSGLTIHTALANVAPDLAPDDRRRAMYVGLSRVAGDTDGQAPRFEQPALGNTSASLSRLKEWFRDCVEVRDADGAERCLRTTVAAREPTEVAEVLFAAATDHVYLNTGHTLDHCNKAFEALDHAGWELAETVVPSLVTTLTGADRAEEQSQWRRPVDIAGLLFDAYDDLPDEASPGGWEDPAGLLDTVLDDDPEATVEALLDAASEGAAPADLAPVVRQAAARRVAQFSTANEFSDWNTVHHTYTYANAVCGATTRTDATELYRGVFDAAMNVYLDRFLNSPPAEVPTGDPGADPDQAIEGLLDTFDREGAVDEAGRHVADFLAGGGDAARLRETLGGALLREDAGFHTIQNVEAAFAAAAEEPPARARVHLVAAARYLCAHTPTRREDEQTFTIAARLHRGESVHGEESEATADD
jgi:nitrite reductase/ring-hydroxylating ferredoxin subunit